jgi:hypothetical protein
MDPNEYDNFDEEDDIRDYLEEKKAHERAVRHKYFPSDRTFWEKFNDDYIPIILIGSLVIGIVVEVAFISYKWKRSN